MSRAPPTSRCLALIRAFDKNLANPEAKIATAAAQIEAALPAAALADMNEGQFAAMIDFVLAKGLVSFTSSDLFVWISGGNLTLPPEHLAFYGDRGRAERDMWNLGNSE